MPEVGKVEYAPDYKSKQPRLPKDWGKVGVLCASGRHRYLPDAPRCGCGETTNPLVEHSRLTLELVERAKTWRRDKTHRSDAALVKAVDALIEFESSQQQIKR